MIKVYKNLNEVINDIGLAETKNKLSRLFNFDNNASITSKYKVLNNRSFIIKESL